jgi:soluble lytic murein transglycosylase-like protein
VINIIRAGLLLCLWGWISLTAVASTDERTAMRDFLEQSIAGATSFEDRFDAEVWLLDMQNRLTPFMPDAQERVQFLTLLHREALAAQLPPELVLALIEVESHFDQFAVSRAGAQGYMQVMPFWKDEIGRPEDNLTGSEVNLRYGCRILQFYWQRESGDLHRALAAYNGSLGSRTYSDKVYRAWESRWRTAPLDW